MGSTFQKTHRHALRDERARPSLAVDLAEVAQQRALQRDSPLRPLDGSSSDRTIVKQHVESMAAQRVHFHVRESDRLRMVHQLLRVENHVLTPDLSTRKWPREMSLCMGLWPSVLALALVARSPPFWCRGIATS